MRARSATRKKSHLPCITAQVLGVANHKYLDNSWAWLRYNQATLAQLATHTVKDKVLVDTPYGAWVIAGVAVKNAPHELATQKWSVILGNTRT